MPTDHLTVPRVALTPRRLAWLMTEWPPERQPAVVLDVSARGCALYTRAKVRPGDAVVLELAEGPAALPGWLELLVAHTRPGPAGGFEVGACFVTPLSEGALRALRSRA
jgi:hypothetical protein